MTVKVVSGGIVAIPYFTFTATGLSKVIVFGCCGRVGGCCSYVTFNLALASVQLLDLLTQLCRSLFPLRNLRVCKEGVVLCGLASCLVF